MVALAALVALAPLPTAAQAAGRSGYLAREGSGSRIYYEECGAGPAVVLIHDGVMGAATWDAVWDGLCAHFHVLRYDRRGIGRSSVPVAPFSPIEDLEALLREVRIPPATVVGSSSGGALAIDFALAHPERVVRLVLLGPVLHGMGYSDHFTQRNLANFAPLDSGNDSAAAANQANDRYTIVPGHAAARRFVLTTLVANPQNLRDAGDTLQQWPVVPAATRLGEVHVPTLILVGEYDIPDVHAHAGAIEFGIWGSRREVVRDAGHLVQLDQPGVVRDTLAAFVAETPVTVVSPERLASVVGTYAPFAAGRPGSFVVVDGRLTARFAHNRDMPLFAANDSTFYTLAWRRFRVTFHRAARAVDISIGGVSPHRALRVD